LAFGANVEPSAPPADAQGQTAPSSPAPEIDPFDPQTYRVSQTLAAAAGVKRHLTELPVCKPRAEWWVRRHPDPEFSLSTWVIELREDQDVYLVLPPLWPSLMGKVSFRPKTLHLAVTMQGKLFFWLVNRPPDETKEPDKWSRTPMEAARLAKDRWTHLYWDPEARQHRVETSDSTVEPEWPDLPVRELLKVAFKDRVIDTLDHPVLRRLRGETP
jgi:hypothetical protein